MSELSEVLLYQSIEGDLYVEVEILEHEIIWCLLVDCRINEKLSFADDFGGTSDTNKTYYLCSVSKRSTLHRA